MSDHLDRMFHLLVSSITSGAPERLTRPFQVQELYQEILPYRLHRRELGLDTNQDYEMVLTELLSGARGYLQVDERMADTLRQELASPNPDASAFRQFAHAEVTIHPDALARVAQQGGSSSRPARPLRAAVPGERSTEPTGEDGSGRGTSGSMSAVSATRPSWGGSPTGRSPIVPASGESCRFCGGELPAGRAITFCPHCGQDQTVLHCEACGTELEVGWKFCTTCGRSVGAA